MSCTCRWRFAARWLPPLLYCTRSVRLSGNHRGCCGAVTSAGATKSLLGVLGDRNTSRPGAALAQRLTWLVWQHTARCRTTTTDQRLYAGPMTCLGDFGKKKLVM